MDWLLNSAFRIGRFAGITVSVHITFLLWIAYRLLSAEGDYAMAAFFSGMLFAIVLVHEYGHCFGARAVGGEAENILMWPLGGLAFARAPMTPWAQFVTVACGPLVNVIFCIASAAVLMVATASVDAVSINPFAGPGRLSAMWQVYVWYFYWLNLMLLCFNLLPIFPMDGGQLFRVALWPFVGLQQATLISSQVGIVGGIGLGLWGISSSNYIMVAIGVNGVFVSYQHLMAAKYGYIIEDRSPLVRRRGSAGGGWWARLWRRDRAERRRYDPLDDNPNPGAWERKMHEEEELEREVDRILAKVKEQGMRSLTYVERQTLERATRRQQEREQELDQNARY
ncbi:MAG: site-2 protease family protein [Planctomycetes bacterium]|nr:site-2 protease family protein [Planctomycetota bacterium]